MGLPKYRQKHEQRTLASSQEATIQIPAGGRICGLMLRFMTAAGADATEADIRGEIANVRLSIGGQDIVNVPAYKLYDLYETLGVKVAENTGVGGVVELNVGRLVYDSKAFRDAIGFGTANVNSIQVSVTAGTLTNIASVQAFTERQNVQENLGTYCRFLNYPQTFNATGDHTADTLPRNIDSAYILAMVDDGASGAISNGECRVNAQTVIEKSPSSVNKLSMAVNGFVQPSGYYVYAFGDGDPTTVLPMQGVTDFRLINTFSAAAGAAGYNISALTIVNLPRSV